jgi:hypothetical protein
MFLGGGAVLLALGAWKLCVAVAGVDAMAVPIGIVAILLGVWLAWRGIRAASQSDVKPSLVQADTRPTPNVSTERRTRKARPTRSPLEKQLDKWVGYIGCCFIVLVLVIGGPPKDEHGRPMKWERGRWVEAPAPVDKPSGSELINIRDMLEASKRSPSEPKKPPITTTEPNTSPGASTPGEHTAKFWRDTVVRLPEVLQSKQSDDAPSWLRSADLSWMRSRFDDRDRVDEELVELVARALVNVEDYREAADEEPHEPGGENNESQPPPSSHPNGAIFPDLPEPERTEWWQSVRKLARTEESRLSESDLASLDNIECRPLADLTVSGEKQRKALERLRINFFQIERLRERLQERYPDERFPLPWDDPSQSGRQLP